MSSSSDETSTSAAEEAIPKQRTDDLIANSPTNDEKLDTLSNFTDDLRGNLPSLDSTNQCATPNNNVKNEKSSPAAAFVTEFSVQQIENAENAFKDVNIVWLQRDPDRKFLQYENYVDKGSNARYQHRFSVGCQKVPIDIMELPTFDECLDYIQMQTNKKVFFIIPTALNEERLICMRTCPQISLIYELDSKTVWMAPAFNTNSFPYDLLLNQLKQLHDLLCGDESGFHLITQQAIEESLSSVDNNSRNFIIYQLLVEIILQSARTEASKEIFINYANDMYAKKNRFIKEIDDFKSSFRPETAIYWYTRGSFVYRLVNYTCCSNNIQKLFKIRYYICSLYDQIKELYPESLSHFGEKLHVYRGKSMILEDFSNFKNSIGNFVITKTFLSTTIDKLVAIHYAGENHPEGTVGVIFQMIIDKSLNPAKPFAYIAPQSAHKDEQEVLVSIATIFRSLSVEKLENHSQIWVITLKRDPTEEVLEKLILDQNLSANAENREENMNIIFDFLQNNHDHRSSNDFIQTLYDHLDTFTPSTSNAPVSSATAQVDTEDTYRQSRLPLSTMITIKLKRIHQELIELERIGIESNALIKFDLQKSSLYKEKDDDAFGQSEDFTIIGRVFPNSYIYRTVSLQIEIKLESTFPFIPPRVRMLTQIYHPNINENGIICIGILDGKKDWYPQTTLVNVIVDITNLIDNPDLGYSINAEAASNYVHNRAEYDRIAMDFAGKYGLPR